MKRKMKLVSIAEGAACRHCCSRMRHSSDRTVAKVILWLLYTELCEAYFLDTTPPPLLSSSEDEGAGLVVSSDED